MSEPIRVQKYLSQKGLYSRRQAEALVRAGRLSVDGKVLTLGDRVIPGAVVCLDGQPLDIPETVEPVLLAFYKPRGVETTLEGLGRKSEAPTLADFDFGAPSRSSSLSNRLKPSAQPRSKRMMLRS